jgi:hypothetical protein
MNTAWTIAASLDRHLLERTEIVVFGSAALLLDQRFADLLAGRMTNDIDIIIPASEELAFDSNMVFWDAIESTNKELLSHGLYVSHIFPEREVVLSIDWDQHLVEIPTQFNNLVIRRPQMLDMILSKMGRGDAQDVEDVRNMIRLEHSVFYRIITAEDISEASSVAKVPEAYGEIFSEARQRIIAAAKEEVLLIEERAGHKPRL